MKDTYVQAILSLLADGVSVDTVLAQTRIVMERRGHTRLYESVLKTVAAKLEEQAATAGVSVKVAKAADADSPAVKALIAELGANDAPVATTIDESLIGGAVATYNYQCRDASYKTILENLYQTITTNR